MAYTIPEGTHLEAWAERNRLCGDYLPLIGASLGVERQKLICDLACKLFDSWADQAALVPAQRWRDPEREQRSDANQPVDEI
jgi:hypothetical protein